MFSAEDFTDITTVYFVTDSPTSQYRNKKNAYLTRKWASKHNIEAFWIFTESGHGKGPMDGVGSAVKTAIKNTSAFNPDQPVKITEQLLDRLPIMKKVIVGTYTDADLNSFKEMYPSNIEELNIVAPSFGISLVHEIQEGFM